MLADSGRKVLLIDTDLKRASLTELLGANVKYDYSDYILGEVPAEKIDLREVSKNFYFLPSKHRLTNSQEIISSDKMKEFINNLLQDYYYIIYDTPPIMAVSDAMGMTEIADKALYVVRWGLTARDIVKMGVKTFSLTKMPTSLVMTRVDLRKHRSYKSGDLAYYYSNYSEYYKNKK